MKTITTRNGLVSRLYWRLLPVLTLSCIVISANAFIDSLFAGRFLGTEAMAVIGLFGPINTIFSGLACIMATGAQQLCCNEMGSGNTKRLRSIFSIGAFFLFSSGIIFTVLLFALKYQIAQSLGTTGNVLLELSSYIEGISFGVIGQLLTCFLMPFLQINGHNRLCYLVLIINMVGNALFNTLFVAIFSWGLFGMGFATSLSSLLCLFVMLPIFCRKDKLVYFVRKDLNPKDLVTIIKIGSPVLMFHIGLFIKNYGMNCALLKTTMVDSIAVLTLQGSLCGILGALGFSNGSTVQMLSSFFIGEDDRDSVKEVFSTAMKNGLFLCFIAIIILLSLSSPLIPLFGLEGGETEIMAKRMIYFLSLAITLNLVLSVFVKLIQSAQKLILANTFPFLENSLQGVFTLFFVGKLGSDAAWLAFPSATGFCLVILLMYGLYGRKEEKKDILGFLHFPLTIGSTVEAKLTSTIRSKDDIKKTKEETEVFAKRNGITDKNTDTVSKCVEEITGNIIDHNKDGIIWSILTLQKDKLVLRIRDNCTSLDPKDYLDLSLHDGEDSCIGRISDLVDKVEYRNSFGMNMVTLEVRR